MKNVILQSGYRLKIGIDEQTPTTIYSNVHSRMVPVLQLNYCQSYKYISMACSLQ